jgi:hypothetical protein
VRDRSGKEHDHKHWLVRDCPAATRDQPKKDGQSIIECASNDDVRYDICLIFMNEFLFEIRMIKNFVKILFEMV